MYEWFATCVYGYHLHDLCPWGQKRALIYEYNTRNDQQKECKLGRYTEMHRLPREMKSEQEWLFAWRLSSHGSYFVLCHKILGVNNSRKEEFSPHHFRAVIPTQWEAFGTEKHLTV